MPDWTSSPSIGPGFRLSANQLPAGSCPVRRADRSSATGEPAQIVTNQQTVRQKGKAWSGDNPAVSGQFGGGGLSV